jgi:hypothetical protein
VSKVCEWRAASDLDFDDGFVSCVYNNIIRPSDAVLAAATESTRDACAARAKAMSKVLDDDTAANRQAAEGAMDRWRGAIESYVLCGHGCNLIVKPAVYKYISTFCVLVVSTTKTEVAQMQFQAQNVDGRNRHVMYGYMSRLKKQFSEAHAPIGELISGWLNDVPAASGFTMDPEFVHEKNDNFFKSTLKLPRFNTFCGFAIDSVITPDRMQLHCALGLGCLL